MAKPAGLGLGLFGVLSIIRLRSSSLAQGEVAYFFAALALGLLGGIQTAPIGMVAALMGTVVAALWVGDHPALETLARVGFVVSGLLHIVLGWTAGRVGWGDGGQADQSGALATLASNPAGTVLMWVITVTLAGLVLWQLTEAVTPGAGDGAADRAKAVGKAVVYAAIAWTAGSSPAGRAPPRRRSSRRRTSPRRSCSSPPGSGSSPERNG